MLINSIDFWLFLAAVALPYYTLLRHSARGQNAWLMLTSFFFYAWADWRLLPLLVLATVVFYGLGLTMEARRNDERAAKRLMWTGVAAGVGILFYFKYLGFCIDEFVALFRALGFQVSRPTFVIIMPLGISYFTFKLISYIVDVRKGTMSACRDGVAFATYVAFFPTIMSGPIDRAPGFIGQLTQPRPAASQHLAEGAKRVLWGMFMKMCIADRINPYTDAVFNNVAHHNGSTIVLASVLYLVQMYSDFAGYSHMAIGVGRLLGINVTENFRQPFFAVNGGDFWRRWHISLSSWLRDYIYIPLGGSRCSRARSYFNVMVTFVACGIWHGANWTYVLFGVHHGLLVILSRVMRTPRERLEARWTALSGARAYRLARQLFTFALCAIGAMYFRANSVGDIALAYQQIAAGWGTLYTTATLPMFTWGMIAVAMMLFKEFQDEHSGRLHFLHSPHRWVRIATCVLLIVFIMLTGEIEGTSFIYVQF